MLTINDILKAVRFGLTKERKQRILDAYEFAKKAHAGQKRKSGDEYVQHSLETALNIAKIGMRSKTITAGILHDVPEDTSVTLSELEEKFGKEIATLVDGVTKLGKIKLRGSKEEYFLENTRKMFLAMAADVRVVIIKLADRLHNMRTLEHLPEEKRGRIAKETMEIFVPIADRLGIGETKGDLEDLSFKFLDPENYRHVKVLEEKQYQEIERYVNKTIKELKADLEKESIKVIEIKGRAKRLHSLYLKLKQHDMDINRIYDLAAVRIIVPNIADCYEALGIVHKKYHPLVGRIKDYISLPKPNGYQSIHTTVFGPEGRILEVQIRTKKMDDEAEFGIASHWIYSEQEKKGWKKYFLKNITNKPEKEVAWMKQLREWQGEIGRDNEEFIDGLKIDFLKNRIFAFTPKGDIINLPDGATPVDFAYMIHSEIGDRTIGAKIDRKIVPLSYKIKNGQVVEILTSKEKKKPSQDWLNFVRTSNAKAHIRRELKKEL
ncbi:MAG: RelA/SpoT family protein [Parcubacteria group bacterium]|jgi:GTP pyrophosphokinase